MPHNPQLVSLQRWKLQHLARQRFEDLEAYILMMESNVRRERAAVDADASLTDIFHPEDVDDAVIDRYQESARRLSDDFPQVLRASALSLVQASLEVHVIAIARFWAMAREVSFDEKTWFKGKGRIWGSKSFLEEGCARAVGADYWKKISDFSNVRNAIVHGDGVITETLHDPTAARAAAGRLQGVRVDGDRIVLDDQVALDFAKTCRFLCADLLRL